MGLIATRDKRDKLRLFYEDSKAQSKPLQQVLMEALRACDQVAPTGTWMTSTNEAGGGASFGILQNLDPRDARRLVGELLDLYDKVVAYLEVGSTDEQIYVQMLGVTSTTGPRLRRVGSYQQDWTGLRYGTGLSLTSSV